MRRITATYSEIREDSRLIFVRALYAHIVSHRETRAQWQVLGSSCGRFVIHDGKVRCDNSLGQMEETRDSDSRRQDCKSLVRILGELILHNSAEHFSNFPGLGSQGCEASIQINGQSEALWLKD